MDSISTVGDGMIVLVTEVDFLEDFEFEDIDVDDL